MAAVDYLKNASVSSTDIPTLAAAYAMQTDYYLWMAKVRKDATALADARTACDNALAAAAAAGKQLLGNFADIFSVTNKLNPEVLFAWSMKKDEKEGGFQSDWLCAHSVCFGEIRRESREGGKPSAVGDCSPRLSAG